MSYDQDPYLTKLTKPAATGEHYSYQASHRVEAADFAPPEPPKPKLWQRRWFQLLAVAFAALVLGVAMGGEGGTKTVTKTVAGPERVVNVPGPTVVKNVPTTPESCKTALDLADQGFEYARQSFVIVAAAFQAVSDGDPAALEAQTKKLKAQGDNFEGLAPKYNAAKAECRAGR